MPDFSSASLESCDQTSFLKCCSFQVNPAIQNNFCFCFCICFCLELFVSGAACGFVYMSNYSIAPNHIEISFKPETYENYPCYVDYARCDDFYHNTNCSVTRSNDFDCNQNVSLENLRNGTQYYFQISFSNLVTGINYYFSNCFTTGEPSNFTAMLKNIEHSDVMRWMTKN